MTALRLKTGASYPINFINPLIYALRNRTPRRLFIQHDTCWKFSTSDREELRLVSRLHETGTKCLVPGFGMFRLKIYMG